jgi:hypothetical protein
MSSGDPPQALVVELLGIGTEESALQRAFLGDQLVDALGELEVAGAPSR